MNLIVIVLLGFFGLTLAAIVFCLRWRLKSTWVMAIGSVLFWVGVLLATFGPKVEETGQSFDANGVVSGGYRTVRSHGSSYYLLGAGVLAYVGGLLGLALTARVATPGSNSSTET